MAEIYKIQTSAQGSMIQSQDRIQLQNDAGKYLQEAARELNRVGQIIDDRSNREATNRMELAKEEMAEHIKNWTDFGPGYMERMEESAMNIWNSAYEGLSRNQRVMFDKNNPCAREIVTIGTAREIGEKSLRHEVDNAKVYNDVKAAQMALDESGVLNSAQTILNNLQAEQDKVKDNPALANFPDQQALIAKDLGHKTITTSLDMALAVGRLGTAEKLIGNKSATKYLSGTEIAQYTSRIKSYIESAKKDAENNGTTTEKVEKSQEKLIALYDSYMRAADRAGIDRQIAEEAFHNITSQIIHGVPADELVASSSFSVFQKAINSSDYTDENLKKFANIAGVMPDGRVITYKDLFGEDNIYCLQTAAKNASSKIAQVNNANVRGNIMNSIRILDSEMNDIINSSDLDSDVKEQAKQPTYTLDFSQMNLTEDKYFKLIDAINTAETYESVYQTEQEKQLNRARELVSSYEDSSARRMGLASSATHIDLNSAVYKGDEFYYLGKRNYYSGNMPMSAVEQFTSEKQPVELSGVIANTLYNAALGNTVGAIKSMFNPASDVQSAEDYSWDATTAAVENSLRNKKLPKPGTYGYLIDAVVGKMVQEANYRNPDTGKVSKTAHLIGAEGKFLGGKEMLKMKRDLMAENSLKTAADLTYTVKDDPTAPIETTTIYSVVKSAINKAGFFTPAGSDVTPEQREDAIRNIALSLRATMRPRSTAALAELSDKQAKMLMDRRDSTITTAAAEAIRKEKYDKRAAKK